MVSMVPLSGLGTGTSDEGDGALDNALCLFIEVESVGADTSMERSLVEETLDHFEEGTAR